MNNVLITIGVLIVAVLSALFAVPYFVDWNTYRGVVEEEVSRVVGRDGAPLSYNARETILNPDFICYADASRPWHECL